ncbi:TetR/AcrR family transcriptional regulator [Oceaniserpentilla sp. 4NH20-0058]|uniref:TetR/AcrR family transcriptional regulator n=1 Tax=Oceaniserpentilla sp. 4NH20-0058 TaxID=3127660 RepID=UPI003102AFE0
MKTRDRIIQASLELFNEQGERNITTNHIAAHLEISPGNLYYHFKNKQQIIFDIYLEYESKVDENLQLPHGRALTVNDKLEYLQKIFQGLWDYRFLHRDLQYLLQHDPDLHKRYNIFFKRCLNRTEAIYIGLRAANIISASDEEIRSVALNTWILVTSWFGFMHTNLLVSGESLEESRELLNAGIYQIFALERPYLTPDYVQPVANIAKQLGKSLDQLSVTL